jgi:hypothetical protein
MEVVGFSRPLQFPCHVLLFASLLEPPVVTSPKYTLNLRFSHSRFEMPINFTNIITDLYLDTNLHKLKIIIGN